MKRRQQAGMFLIEALVGIMLFMIGILGLVGLSAFAIAAQSDAQYRTEAANIASQITQEAWVNVDRTGATPQLRATALKTSLLTFRHNTSGEACNFSGNASGNTAVTGWLTSARKLPGATTAMQQILVDTDETTGFNRMTVTVCWKVPSNPVARQHVLATYVN